MSSKHHRLGLNRFKRYHNSSDSSSNLDPIIPVLESPVMFHAMMPGTVSEVTLKQKSSLERNSIIPSVFIDEAEEEESTVPEMKSRPSTETRPPHLVNKSFEEEPASRLKTRYFEDAFSARGPMVSPRTRINQESIVVVDIRCNTRTKDNETIVSQITSRLAQIYQKPTPFMMVTLQQDACIQFGVLGSPAYLMKIFALPYLIAPITNLRSTILIQSALQDVLQVPPNRGVVLYIPIHEENFASNGVTVMGEIARLERYDQETGILKNISRSMTRRMKSSSVTTSSSWGYGHGSRASTTASASGHEHQDSEVSAGREDGRSWSVKKAHNLGRLLSRGRSVPGSSDNV